MGAAEDMVNAKMKNPSMGYAAMVKAGEVNTPPEKPKIPPADPNAPANPVPDQELNWVQKMTKQVHDYLTRKKKENNADPNAIG